jgi:hypothetical protein
MKKDKRTNSDLQNLIHKIKETTWGAGHTDKNKKFNKKFTNFFFLTPPQSFFTDHFPYMNNNIEDSKQWHLLEKGRVRRV